MSSLAREKSVVSEKPPSRALSSANSTLQRSRQRADIDPETEEELLFLSRPVTHEDSLRADPLKEDPENFRLELTPVRALEPHEVRQEIYRRECRKLNVIPLSSYLRNPIRNVLVVPHSGLGPRGAMALAAPLMLDHNIVYLDIAGNSIGPLGLEHMVEAFLETLSITHLNLSDNELGSAGAKTICNTISKQSIFEYLDLSNNGFKDEDSILFADAIETSKSLREVILSHNHFAEKAGVEFGRALANNDRLEAFDIRWNHINGRSADAFAKGVKKNVGLKRLDISFNGFGPNGCKALAAALLKNRTLQELDMSHNRMVDEDIAVLAESLMANDTLKTLVVGDNLLTHASSLHILKSIEDPKSVTVLEKVDLKNVCVDQEFVHLLNEVKEIKSIEIKHGRIMQVGKPRRRRRRRKPKPKPEVQTEKTDLSTKESLEHNKAQENVPNEQVNKLISDIKMSEKDSVLHVKEERKVDQIPPLAPPPSGIVRESMILGPEIVNEKIGENSK
ncbi:leucine-rich repeat-containing protein 74B-like [Saccostrea cucullata]|uniref:leucine-rich repeat-containing protein 74B-like n=1 Tax=Saccostrea cuccullata TaxID=36930 RepID=UPI002ED25283